MKQTHSILKSPQFNTLTREQAMSIMSTAKTQRVVARAGSGKTKLAMGYAYARRAARGLYLAFGKPTQMEAAAKLHALGVNTVAKTQHSLAWPAFGSKFDEANKLAPGMRVGTTADLLGVNWAMAKAINATVTNYMSSADTALGEQHLPDPQDFPVMKFASGAVMDQTLKFWSRLINLDDVEAKVSADVYLKLWANTAPKLDYDFIIFDECQDANPLAAHLVNSQEHCSRVYIGDQHQAIYAFRGAVNLMDELNAEETHTLTASFRFGPGIGELASTFLRHWKGEPLPLIGKGAGGRPMNGDQCAHLSRTVAGLIGKGFELHEKGHKIHWIKGFDDYRVKPILEAYNLFKGKSGDFQDPVLKLMHNWGDLKEYVETTGDSEAGAVYRLVEQYRDAIPHIIETLRREQLGAIQGAPHVLTTAHKSKGLEFPVVRLINDFFSFKDPSDGTKWMAPHRIDPQEANLYYVALTRAMKAIAPTTEMVEWFRQQPSTAKYFPAPPKPSEPAPAQEQAPSLQPA